jgi:hypothetical protein
MSKNYEGELSWQWKFAPLAAVLGAVITILVTGVTEQDSLTLATAAVLQVQAVQADR